MNFEYPAALFFLFSLPLIIILNLVRRRKKTYIVTSLMVWERVVRENRRLFRIRSIIRNINLLLQLLMALALSLALARPVVRSDRGFLAGNVILVVDTSASMQAETGRGTRFDEARRKAREYVDRLSRESEMMIIVSGRPPRIVTPFIKDRNRLKDIIDELSAWDIPDAMETTLKFALSLANIRQGDSVVCITDTAFDAFSDPALENAFLLDAVESGPGENCAITNFQFRKLPVQGQGYQLYVETSNFGTQEKSFTLTVKADRYVLSSVPVDLAPGQKKEFVFAYDETLAGSATVEINPDDDLSADDRSYAVFQKERYIDVLLLTPGNIFLETVFGEHPSVHLTLNDPDADPKTFDLTVFDKVPPPPLTTGNYLLVDTLALNVPALETGTAGYPRITAAAFDHPVMKSVDILDTIILSALEIESEKEIVPLFVSGSIPLSFAYSVPESKLKIIYLGFDLLRSDFPLRSSFPIFINNAVNWLTDNFLENPETSFESGKTVTIPVPGEGTVRITGPDGYNRSFARDENRVSFPDTLKTGFYTVADRSDEVVSGFSINLLNAGESNITPRYSAASGMAPERESVREKDRTEIWPFLVFLALLAALAEWFFLVRKGVS